MKISRLLAGGALVAAVTLIAVENGVSQEKKEPPKTKGQIPTGWSKLNLDAAQKQSIYAVQAEYKEKITKLEEEIKKLEAERYKKMVGVLTPAQKKQLTDGLVPDTDPKPKGKDGKEKDK